jgi:hypothetical protein
MEYQQGEQQDEQDNQRWTQPGVPKPVLDGCSEADHPQRMLVACAAAGRSNSRHGLGGAFPRV